MSVELARKLLHVLAGDRPRLIRIDNYMNGIQDDPYMPQNADDEYRLLARRCISNWMPLLVGTPAQALYVDGFRRGRAGQEEDGGQPGGIDLPEWDHWQRSRLDARQSAVVRGALTFGHSFTLTEKERAGLKTKGLSALSTSAVFRDAANDDVPEAALHVTKWPSGNGDKSQDRGEARMWDGRFEYLVKFRTLTDKDGISVSLVKPHGAPECPVTRFAASVDLDGRTVGVVEPFMPVQDRINQTIFDLLLAQTYNSTEVRYATGMAPPIKRDDQGEPELDGDNNPIPIPMNHNARRFLFAEDPDVKFGSLPGSSLSGFIESIDMSIRHLAAVSQTPPHHLLGQIANLSAEALTAAETSLSRKVEEFRHAFGEAWERVFRLAAIMDGNEVSADDVHGEVIWRDMESRSIGQSADALGKLKDQLSIPARGLWPRVPGVTQAEIAEWERLAEEDQRVEIV